MKEQLIQLNGQLQQATTRNRQLVLQEQLDNKISELRSTGDGDSVVLELISVNNRITEIQRLITVHTEKSRVQAADLQRQWRQKTELVKKLILQLNREENNTQLTLTASLEEKKKRQQDLKKQLEDADFVQAETIIKIISTMKEVRELKDNEQDQTTSQETNLQTLFEAKEREYAKSQAEVKDLRRKLRLKGDECSGLQYKYDELKTEFEDKVAELNRTGDSKEAVVLGIINLNDELKALTSLITTAEDPDQISELQSQLEKKKQELTARTADLERLSANPQIIVRIIALQNEIWDLQKVAANQTTGDRVEVLTNQLMTKKEELQKHISELNEKDKTNANLILTITDLQNQLRDIEKEKDNEKETSAATTAKLMEQLNAKVEENSQAQTLIQVLQKKLDQKEAQCSDTQEKHERSTVVVFVSLTGLQKDLDDKMKELEAKSDSVTPLVLGIINLNDELKALTSLITTAEDPDQISELQSQLEKKKQELTTRTADLERLSANPQIIVRIIALQNEIWDLQKVAANQTTGDRVEVLTNQLMTKKEELQKHISELNEKDKTNANLILTITDLQNQLRDIEKEKDNEKETSAATTAKLMEQLNAKVEENSQAQTLIQVLQKKLDQKEAQCSDTQEKHERSTVVVFVSLTGLQKDLDDKMKELEAKSDSVTSLELKEEIKELKICCADVKCDDLQRQLAQSHQDADRLQQQLHESNANFNRLQQELEDMKRENNKLQDKYNSLENETNMLQDKVEDLRNKLNDVDDNTVYPSALVTRHNTGKLSL
ncbi:putative leucine-rich repeat-containing protein DDB_G0290503 [Centroberyx affinis]|uniref:putative leucine-rich repeat-containing protein DDB_G0290503 n=1 Tax=Centroberyx affinis TaxID=166261 RepID=UPI003A5C08AA